VAVSDTLDRLLGPTGPDLGCDACFELLDRYVEHELAGRLAELPEAEAMANHLAGCPACREEHASLRDLVAADARGG
jgi:anti-sigma factor RsiW